MQELITVLIADDNGHMRKSLQVILSPVENIRIVAEAKNGTEAITLTEKHQPDIILMDINMSPVNGFEAARKILKQNPSAKIIALSLHSATTYCRNMIRIGAKGYVCKSAPYKEIIDAILEVAAGKNYVDKSIKQ